MNKKDPPPRRHPSLKDWAGFDYIPFKDAYGYVYQVKKDSPEFYEAVNDNDLMLNKEEYYRHIETQRHKANNEPMIIGDIPLAYRNPKGYDLSKEAHEKRKAENDWAVNNKKLRDNIIDHTGNIAGLISLIPGPQQPFFMGLAIAADGIKAYNNYDDARNNADYTKNKEYNYSRYVSENKADAAKDWLDLALDASMFRTYPKFNLRKGLNLENRLYSFGVKHRKVLNPINKTGLAADAANDAFDELKLIKKELK